jgi:hypothetical protein
MSRYSGWERFLARTLAPFPSTKAAVKRLYQRVVYLPYGRGVTVECAHELTDFGAAGVESFAGYYDKSPLSPDARHLFWHETTGPTAKPPSPLAALAVVIADADGGEQCRFETHAYNWQQGARLQWIDNHRVAFNDFDAASQRYVARVVTTDGKELAFLPVPLADAHGAAGIGVTLDFRRLATLRPDYGYFNLPRYEAVELQRAPDDDGLWLVDLADGHTELVASLHQLARDTDPAAIHKVNHPMISPDGRRCIFLHRYIRRGSRRDRLMLLDLPGHQVTELADTGMVSHMAWQSDRELLGYLRGPDGSDGFFSIDLETRGMRPLGPAVMGAFGDGHPSIFAGRFIVYDSYPDKARMQRLFRLDLADGYTQVQLLGAFFHGLAYEGICRCDLHPRYGRNRDEIFFDSVYDGRRRLRRLRIRN